MTVWHAIIDTLGYAALLVLAIIVCGVAIERFIPDGKDR